MAKKAKKIEAPVETPKVESAPKAAPAVSTAAPKLTLEARVVEIEGDLVRLVNLLGAVFGDPLAKQAREIVAKRQGVVTPMPAPH